MLHNTILKQMGITHGLKSLFILLVFVVIAYLIIKYALPRIKGTAGAGLALLIFLVGSFILKAEFSINVLDVFGNVLDIVLRS